MLIDGLILADISWWQRPCLITFDSMFANVCKGLRIMILTQLLIATRKYKYSKLNWERFQNVVLLGRKFIVIPVGASVQKPQWIIVHTCNKTFEEIRTILTNLGNADRRIAFLLASDSMHSVYTFCPHPFYVYEVIWRDEVSRCRFG